MKIIAPKIFRLINIFCLLALVSLLVISCYTHTNIASNQGAVSPLVVEVPSPTIARFINSDTEDLEPFPPWHSASFLKDSAWIMTSQSGLISTYNGGKTWLSNLAEEVKKIRCLTFVTTEEGFALDSKGIILKTNDAGKTWKKVSTIPIGLGEVAFVESQIRFMDQLNGFIVISPGHLWGTSDGGKNWQELHPFNATKNLRCALTGGISIKGDNIWLTAEPGILFKSEDRGKTWSFQKIQNSSGLFYDVFFISEKTGWVTGFPGLGVFRTDNSGANWKVQLPFVSSAKSISINSLYFINENEGWAVGQNKWEKNGSGMGHGAVLHTVDGGTSWKQVQVGKGDSICSWVHFTNVNQGWILDRNNIYHTSNKGETWELVKSLIVVKK